MKLLVARAVFRVKESSWAVFPSIWVAPREVIDTLVPYFFKGREFFYFRSACATILKGGNEMSYNHGQIEKSGNNIGKKIKHIK